MENKPGPQIEEIDAGSNQSPEQAPQIPGTSKEKRQPPGVSRRNFLKGLTAFGLGVLMGAGKPGQSNAEEQLQTTESSVIPSINEQQPVEDERCEEWKELGIKKVKIFRYTNDSKEIEKTGGEAPNGSHFVIFEFEDRKKMVDFYNRVKGAQLRVDFVSTDKNGQEAKEAGFLLPGTKLEADEPGEQDAVENADEVTEFVPKDSGGNILPETDEQKEERSKSTYLTKDRLFTGGEYAVVITETDPQNPEQPITKTIVEYTVPPDSGI